MDDRCSVVSSGVVMACVSVDTATTHELVPKSGFYADLANHVGGMGSRAQDAEFVTCRFHTRDLGDLTAPRVRKECGTQLDTASKHELI